ncbi:hypothetical protein DVK02_13585 [Halobellus sp. Atlit-31R]|nr:hypothetical protein DVK02_13585 [Halobellus sp. Atlit-31R]
MMTPTGSDTGSRVVTWTAFLDLDAERFRLVVLHLAAGVPVVIGLAVLALPVFIATSTRRAARSTPSLDRSHSRNTRLSCLLLPSVRYG